MLGVCLKVRSSQVFTPRCRNLLDSCNCFTDRQDPAVSGVVAREVGTVMTRGVDSVGVPAGVTMTGVVDTMTEAAAAEVAGAGKAAMGNQATEAAVLPWTAGKAKVLSELEPALLFRISFRTSCTRILSWLRLMVRSTGAASIMSSVIV